MSVGSLDNVRNPSLIVKMFIIYDSLMLAERHGSLSEMGKTGGKGCKRHLLLYQNGSQ